MDTIKAFLFDFGGVLSEEGFKEGLKAIGKKNGLNPDDFYLLATELIHETGYVTGMVEEYYYWKIIRERTGIAGSDEELREEVLKRFSIRPEMMRCVEQMKSSGYVVAILSDQTNWLDEINQRSPFYLRFDYVFNSFRVRKSKRDPSIFGDVCAVMGLKPEEVLFVDDNSENIKRASAEGLATIHFREMNDFENQISKLYMR